MQATTRQGSEADIIIDATIESKPGWRGWYQRGESALKSALVHKFSRKIVLRMALVWALVFVANLATAVVTDAWAENSKVVGVYNTKFAGVKGVTHTAWTGMTLIPKWKANRHVNFVGRPVEYRYSNGELFTHQIWGEQNYHARGDTAWWRAPIWTTGNR